MNEQSHPNVTILSKLIKYTENFNNLFQLVRQLMDFTFAHIEAKLTKTPMNYESNLRVCKREFLKTHKRVGESQKLSQEEEELLPAFMLF